MTGSRVVSAIRGDLADRLLGRDLIQQLGEHRAIAHTASGHLDGADLQRVCVDAQMKLAPLPRAGGAVLACAPLTFTCCLEAGAVDEKVQGARTGALGDRDSQALLASAERAEVRHRQIQSGQLEQARYQPGRLAQG